MNSFIGIGKIADTSLNGRVLKFNLCVQQQKPCLVPCVLFDPTDEAKAFVDELQTGQQVVWLRGRVASYEFEYQGRIIRKIQVVTYARSIKPI
jgi:hypothetical protein